MESDEISDATGEIEMNCPRKIYLFLIFVFMKCTSQAFAQKPDFEIQNGILNEAFLLLSPRAQQEKGNLVIRIDETRSSIGASAKRDSLDSFEIILDKGLIGWPRLTEDALRMIICHEAGHLWGGAPHKSPPIDWDGPIGSDGLSLMSAEGQADYFAAKECFKQWVQDQDHTRQIKNAPNELKQKCENKWGPSSNESGLCQRSALAGKDFLNLVKDFEISFATPAQEVVEKTLNDEYPSRQCRLDTFLAGALQNPRPLCWYR